MALVKIQHKASGTVKDADPNVAKQLIDGGEYEAHVEQKTDKKPVKGNEKSDDKGGADAGKTGIGDGAGS